MRSIHRQCLRMADIIYMNNPLHASRIKRYNMLDAVDAAHLARSMGIYEEDVPF